MVSECGLSLLNPNIKCNSSTTNDTNVSVNHGTLEGVVNSLLGTIHENHK